MTTMCATNPYYVPFNNTTFNELDSIDRFREALDLATAQVKNLGFDRLECDPQHGSVQDFRFHPMERQPLFVVKAGVRLPIGTVCLLKDRSVLSMKGARELAQEMKELVQAYVQGQKSATLQKVEQLRQKAFFAGRLSDCIVELPPEVHAVESDRLFVDKNFVVHAAGHYLSTNILQEALGDKEFQRAHVGVVETGFCKSHPVALAKSLKNLRKTMQEAFGTRNHWEESIITSLKADGNHCILL